VLDDVLNALSAKNCKPRRGSSGWEARCPAHDDEHPSLTVDQGRNGGVVLKCHAGDGCELDDILAGLGLDREAVRPPRRESTNVQATYPYTDEDGQLLFEVVRLDGKQFRQRRRDPTQESGWTWNLRGLEHPPLYRLPQVVAGIKEGRLIFVCEGEKDVGALERAGEVATCNPMGAGKWRPWHTAALEGASVVVVTDRDEPGRDHARKVARELQGVALSVVRVEPTHGKDAFDHLAAGYTVAQFVTVSEDEPEEDLVPDLHEFLLGEDAFDWLIPELLERGERFMLTGPEGRGKSQFLRQLAIMTAAGIHLFSFDPMPPRRVLFVDCENSERQSRRRLRPLRDQAERQGHPIAPGMMRVVIKPRGLDLTREDDSEWLLERVRAHRPDLLVVGPLYRLHTHNPSDEQIARRISAVLDEARLISDATLVLEAHSPHAQDGQVRNVRPLGSSLWLRWPDFGYGIAPKTRSEAEFRTWRGPRDERGWPDELFFGTGWPWLPRWREAAGKAPRQGEAEPPPPEPPEQEEF
jgi:AAA domain/Toprim domain